jgi:hypothetical protein
MRVGRAAVYEAPLGPFLIREYPVRPARPDEALVRVTMSTICRSDIHILRGPAAEPGPGHPGPRDHRRDRGARRRRRAGPAGRPSRGRRSRDLDRSGYVWINGTGRYLGAPYGGWKQSGIGQEECFDELLSYTRVKNVNLRW